jgi:hypothetical protein
LRAGSTAGKRDVRHLPDSGPFHVIAVLNRLRNEVSVDSIEAITFHASPAVEPLGKLAYCGV